MNNNNLPADIVIDPKLAEAIAFVLNHPELPERLYNALSGEISEIFNEDCDQSSVIDSAAYIDIIMRGYHKKKNSESVTNVRSLAAA